MWDWIVGFIIQYSNVLVILMCLVGAVGFAWMFWEEIKEQDWWRD